MQLDLTSLSALVLLLTPLTYAADPIQYECCIITASKDHYLQPLFNTVAAQKCKKLGPKPILKQYYPYGGRPDEWSGLCAYAYSTQKSADLKTDMMHIECHKFYDTSKSIPGRCYD